MTGDYERTEMAPVFLVARSTHLQVYSRLLCWSMRPYGNGYIVAADQEWTIRALKALTQIRPPKTGRALVPPHHAGVLPGAHFKTAL